MKYNTLRTGLLLLSTIVPCLVLAQKTKVNSVRQELSQARIYIKSGKNLDKAEQMMTRLLKDSANREDKRIYQVWYEAVRGQYDQANERFYLKQKQDTVAFFGYIHRMFTIAESLDSIDMRPDKKGRVAPEYRKKHSEQLDGLRLNLYNGGTYYVQKERWKEAYNFMETYMDCARQPLFAAYAYDSTDQRMPEAAYWATYSGYKQNDPLLTLRYRELALQDSTRTPFVLQFVAEARRWLNDSELYIATLQEGFRRYPQFPYFFPRLMDAYTSAGRYEQALALTDSALAVCDSCELYLYAKSSTLLRLERWEESLTYSDRIIQMNDSMAEAHFNAGVACVNLTTTLNPKKEKKQVKAFYQQARAYMERYRQLMPNEQGKWAPVLYRIYLNLNMGRQFDEIDRLLREK